MNDDDLPLTGGDLAIVAFVIAALAAVFANAPWI